MEKNKINDYLKGKLSKSEDLKVQLWMAAHCEDEILLGQLDEYFSDLDDTDDSRWDDELIALERRLGILHGWNLKKWLTAAAVAVCLIILPASGYLTGVKTASESQTAWIEMNVPKGQTDSLVLSDGTRLNLNSGTKLIYPEVFKGNKREIIVDGEIIADVAKDPDRPFYIKSGASTIKVTGTKFDFKSFEADNIVEIALLEGSVDYSWKIDAMSRSVSIEAGNLMKLDKSTAEISVSQLNVGRYKTFTQDRSIHFIDEPLSDIASALERAFDTKIVILNESLAKTHYLAYFLNNESLDEILSALNASQEMEISRHDNVIAISRRPIDE